MAFDPQQFGTTLMVEETAPIPSLQSDLDALRRFDHEMEAQQSKHGTRGCLLGAVSFGSLFLIPLTAGLSLVLTVPCVIVLVLSIKRYLHFSRQNTENRRYELVASVLRLVAADTGPEAPVALHLDLRSAERQENKQREGKVGVWSVNYYEHAWLRLRGRLLDGTSWTLTATERLQVRRKTYRSRSGKTKSKTKRKSMTLFGLALAPKEKRYGSMSGLAAQTEAAVQLPEWAVAKRVTAEGDGLALKAFTKLDWSEPAPAGQAGPVEYRATPRGRGDAPNKSLVVGSTGPRGSKLVGLMFLSLYQHLNTVRRRAG